MDLTLTRFKSDLEGVFSYLKDENGNQIAVTCEHAYPTADGHWYPKIPPGEYLCQRGTHQLSVGLPFETFEVTKVPNCWGILFHKGNVDADSEGCILVGTSFGFLSSEEAVLDSHDAFDKFMEVESGCDQFNLKVE